jgi:RNA polymerase sigma-70 factor (ECF subfamily)
MLDLYADHLFRFKNLRHEEDARDIVQNSFEILWLHRQELAAEKAKSYLFTVGYRNMIDHVRKTKRVSLTDSFREEESTKEPPVRHIRAVIEQGLERLNEVQRSLILLKDYEGYSYGEIARITGLSASQVKVYLHRARLQLKKFMVSIDHVL